MRKVIKPGFGVYLHRNYRFFNNALRFVMLDFFVYRWRDTAFSEYTSDRFETTFLGFTLFGFEFGVFGRRRLRA